MNFKDWYYHLASEAERAEARRVAEATAGLPEYERTRKRARYKVTKLCRGRGLTITTDTAKHCMRWRVAEAAGSEEMQFGSEEEAKAFAREETRTVAEVLGSIVPVWLVGLDGKAEVI